MTKPKPRWMMAVLAVGVGAILALAWRGLTVPVPQQGQAAIGGPFELVDMNGKPVNEKILLGKWSIVFFGFTHCPDICPTTLAVLADAQTALRAKGQMVGVVFISVDPARDTPDMIKTYLSSPGLPQRLLGLTGSEQQVAAVAKAYRVYYQKAGTGDDYMVDHSSTLYLMAPDGRLSAISSADEGADTIAQKFGAAIAGNARL